MTNTTHYNMTIAEGTDVVNPLTQIFPNFNTIDGAMFANKQAGIGTASEVTTGTVHAIVRANTDSNVFRFTATSAWTAGDTMTLDGNAVIVHMSDGTVPATGAYIIGAEVLAMVNAGLVTLALSSNGGVTSFNTRTGNVMPEASDYTASDIDFDNTNTTLTSTDVQGAVEEVNAGLAALDAEINKGSVNKTSTTSMTYAAFFNQLLTQIDTTKVTPKSYLRAANTIYSFMAYTSQGGFEFASVGTSSSDFSIADIILNPEDSRFNVSTRSTTTPYSTQNAPIGFSVTFFY